MQAIALPFRLDSERLAAKLEQFNARREIQWFGLRGSFQMPSQAVVSFKELDSGILGGGGIEAVNGGVIAAGFDGAFVLAGLGHYDTDIVVTLELSVKFLDLAANPHSLAWCAYIIRSSKRFSFAEAKLIDTKNLAARPVAVASAMVAPAI
jgi:acyl-coenzyme A thioesterase PaaI-like protein